MHHSRKRINGRVTSRVTIVSTGRKFAIRSGLEKKVRSCGQFGTKLLLLILCMLQSLSNVFFCIPNTNESVKHIFWIAIKP